MTYLEPHQEAGRALFLAAPDGPITMLNLLRFRDVADYFAHPELEPPTPLSGAQAYARYTQHTMPFLTASGGEVLYEGRASEWFIGPAEERWDRVLLVRQSSLQRFFSFASDSGYLAGLGHRTAALEDSRLLPSF